MTAHFSRQSNTKFFEKTNCECVRCLKFLRFNNKGSVLTFSKERDSKTMVCIVNK